MSISRCKKLFLMALYIIVGLVFKKEATLFDKKGLTRIVSSAEDNDPTNDIG